MRRNIKSWVWMLFIVGSSAAPVMATIEGRMIRVGPFAGGSNIARNGSMSFAEIELRNTDLEPFSGELRLTQVDRDGDVAVSINEGIVVEPDGEWKSFEIYFMPNAGMNGETVRVTLYNEKGEIASMTSDTGEPIKHLQSLPFYNSPDVENYLVASVSDSGVTPHVAFLEFSKQDVQNLEIINERLVRGMSPRELPRRGIGLDAVDAIVWEDADPSALSPNQIEALADWVQRGGRLLITVSNHWQKFQGNSLSDLLGLEFTGVEEMTAPEGFFEILNRQTTKEQLLELYKKNPVSRCLVAPSKDVSSFPYSTPPEDAFAFRRQHGRGVVMTLTGSLMDLMPPPKKSTLNSDSGDSEYERKSFGGDVERVVGQALLALPRKQKPQSGGFNNFFGETNLFAQVVRRIGFSTVTAAFLFFAIAFAAIYTFVATFGSYLYLRKRDLTRHCWTAFTVVSLVGTVIGTGVVWVLRGFSTQVVQTAVIDSAANQNYGYGVCLFGVKAHEHTRFDLGLPVGYNDGNQKHGPLVVLPTLPRTELDASTFTASDTYRFGRSATALIDVPVRATLKEFMGYWHGELGGSLDARLVFNDRDDEFTTDSFVRNNLGFPLDDCYLIYTDQSVAGMLGQIDVKCLQLKRLAEQGDGAVLQGESLLTRIYEMDKVDVDGNPTRVKKIDMGIGKYIDRWRQRIGSISQYANTGGSTNTRKIDVDTEHAWFLLLSFYNMVPEVGGQNSNTLARSLGRTWDCSHLLTRDRALIVGFSQAPPKARIEIDRISETPRQSLTLYRFVVPIERR